MPIYHNYKLDRKHSQQFKALEGAWPSGLGAGPEILLIQSSKSRSHEIVVKGTLDFFPGRPRSNSSATLLHSQLVCLMPVEI